MKKAMVWIVVLALMMPVSAAPVFAAVKKGVADAGNKTCPVSGDPVSGQDFITYNGVRYGLCCRMCVKPFLKDPKKYLSAMAKGEPAGGMSMVMSDTSPSEEKKNDAKQGSLS
jgi:YHS domain-containing protein